MTTELTVTKTSHTSYLTDPAKFEHIWRVAKCFALSTLTPDTLRNKPEDCFILCQLAMRLDVDPFMLMQNTYVVHGRPGMEAKLQIGLLNASGIIDGGIKYRFGGDGDEYGCTAVVVDRRSGQEIAGPKITWRLVKAEKWDQDKKSKTGYVQVSKWKTMPELMFRYRAASVLIHTQFPEVTLGLMTPEELEEQVIDVEATLSQPARLPGQSKADAIAAALSQPGDKPTPQDVAEADAGSKPPAKRRGRPPKATQEPTEAEQAPKAEPATETQPEDTSEPEQAETDAFDEPAAIEEWERVIGKEANQIGLQAAWQQIQRSPEWASTSPAGQGRVNEALTKRWAQLG